MNRVVGYMAAALTTGAFLPQTIKTIRTRDVKGLSSSMYGAFTLGVFLWTLYGVLMRAPEIIVANAITLALSATILTILISEKRSKKTTF